MHDTSYPTQEPVAQSGPCQDLRARSASPAEMWTGDMSCWTGESGLKS